MKESEVQKLVIDFLEILKGYGLLDYFRINMGGRVYKGRMLKNSSSGFTDTIILANGVTGYLEIKKPKGGVLSDEQKAFRDRVEFQNCPWGRADTLTQAAWFVEKKMKIMIPLKVITWISRHNDRIPVKTTPRNDRRSRRNVAGA